jgi:TRAP-type mannitol/chloroaromatic compound transport system substrate-binding protein
MSINRRQFLGTGAAATTLAAPTVLKAQDQRTHRLRMATSFPAGQPVYTTGPGGALDFAERVKQASGGRLEIQVFSAGEIMPAFEVFDNTSAGNIDCHWSCAYYWSGKSFAAQYFTTVPFGMSYQGHTAWLTQGGGQELWEELYSDFNLVPLPVGSSGAQMGGWFKEPFESLEDLKGKTFRIPGLAGSVYEEAGLNVRLLSGGEIFPALERGVIDAAEWVGPYLDSRLGLHDAAKHYYAVDWHEPSTMTEVVFNQNSWNQLPDDLKAVVRNVATTCMIMSHLQAEANNAQALRELTENQGVQLHRVPESVQKELYTITRDILRDRASGDSMIRKVNNSFWKFKRDHDLWQNTSETAFQSISRDIANEDDLIV